MCIRDRLKEFLKKVEHPVVKGVVRPADGEKITEGWAEEVEEVAPAEAAAEAAPAAAPTPTAAPQAAMPQLQFPMMPTAAPQIQLPTTPAGAPVRIILKDATITIGKLILKKEEK